MRDFIGSATRAAPDGEPASDAGSPAPEEFPSEFADYHLGARAYRSGNYETAGIAWEALLTRPAAERRFRTVWAMFMIGKTAIEQERWDDAVAWFGKTRGAAREGFKDSIGLAAASLGWEAQAHLRAGRLSESARAYLEQLAAGDIGAVRSLRIVLQEIEMKEIPGAELAGDPILQRLKIAQAVAFLMPYPGEKIDPDPAQNPALAWLRALEAIGAKNVRDADRVAWLAYAQGDYAGAVRWLARAEEASPSTLWLRAKLALREGKLAAAATLLSEALPKLPATPPLETRYTPADAMPPDAAARADLGALRLARGDYLAALKLFLDAGLPFDAEYLAEGVLTVAELKGFVDRECPPKQKSAPKPAPPSPAS